MRNSSITHPNCAYLEVESVGAKESLLWKQALCWQASQTERERERAMQGIFKSRSDTMVDRMFSLWWEHSLWLVDSARTESRHPCSIFTDHTWEKVNRHVEMIKAWRGESCLLKSSSPSLGHALNPDFHFFEFVALSQISLPFLYETFSKVTQNI